MAEFRDECLTYAHSRARPVPSPTSPGYDLAPTATIPVRRFINIERPFQSASSLARTVSSPPHHHHHIHTRFARDRSAASPMCLRCDQCRYFCVQMRRTSLRTRGWFGPPTVWRQRSAARCSPIHGQRWAQSSDASQDEVKLMVRSVPSWAYVDPAQLSGQFRPEKRWNHWPDPR